MTTNDKSLNERISAVIAEVIAIPKAKTPGGPVYAFRGIDAVMNAVKPIISKHGVNIICEVISSTVKDRDYEDKFKNPKHAVVATVHLKVGFTDGKETQYWEEVAMSEDHSDKALTQAMSMAYKYAVIRKLCIATEGILDGDAREPERLKDEAVSLTEMVDAAVAQLANLHTGDEMMGHQAAMNEDVRKSKKYVAAWNKRRDAIKRETNPAFDKSLRSAIDKLKDCVTVEDVNKFGAGLDKDVSKHNDFRVAALNRIGELKKSKA